MAIALVLMIGSAGAYAAFTATTDNPGNSIAAASSFGRCLVDDVKADNPGGYWRFDESSGASFADSSGNSNTGTLAGGYTRNQPGSLADPASKATAFNGSTGYGAVPNSASIQTGNTFTWETWVKRSSATSGGGFLMAKTSGGAGQYIFLNNNGTIDLYNNSPSVKIASSTATIKDTSWHQVAWTKSGSTTALYIDGVNRTGTVTDSTIAATTDSIIFATNSVTWFNGSMDDAAVFPTALTAARIRAHYNSARCYRDEPRADNPTAVWRLGEGAGSAVAFDGASTRNGIFFNGPTLGAGSLLDTDSANSAVAFDDVDDRIDVPDAAALRIPGDMAVEAWIKPNALPPSGRFTNVLSKGTNYALIVYSNGLVSFQQCFNNNGCNSIASAQAPAGTVKAGNTYHLAGTVSGNTLTLYVDGIAVGTGTRSSSADTDALPLQIGRSTNGAIDAPFNGTIDEPAVYSSSLSAARVRDHYVGGRSYVNVIRDSSPTGFWRLGETSGPTAANAVAGSSGTYSTGYSLGTPPAPNGEADTAATFNGTSGNVIVPTYSAIEMGDTVSLEAWVRRTSRFGSDADIFQKRNAAGSTYGFELSFNSSNYLTLGQAVGSNLARANVTTTDSEWHHVVATHSGASNKIYIDGVDRTVNLASGSFTSSTRDLFIGSNNSTSTGTAYFGGSIDEPAVYNRVLPASEVALHYAAGLRQPR